MKILMKWVIILCLFAAVTFAAQSTLFARQEETRCADLAAQSLVMAETQCAGIGRNQACYGHINLDAQPQPDVTRFEFDSEGDTVDVTDLQTLRLSSVDLTTSAWGVALLELQANLPDSAPADQSVKLVLFGNTQIENVAVSVPLVEVAVSSLERVNIRRTPSLDAWILTSAAPGDRLVATGRLADGSWLRVKHPRSGETGWVFADLLQGSEIETLAVVEASEPYYGPMQAFYFRSGTVSEVCRETPNGLLIQTPEGVGEVTFLINEVNIQFGSTLFFQSDPGHEMSIDVLEGSATVSAFGQSVHLAAGSGLTIPITEDLRAADVPGEPRPYRMESVQFVPMSLLPREVEIAPPLDESALESPPAVDTLPPVPTATLLPTDTPVPPPPPTSEPDKPRPTHTATATLAPGDTPTPTETLTFTPTDTDTPVPTDTPIPTDTFTPVPTDTPTDTCPPPPPSWQNLQLTGLCSPDPDSYRVWRVTNTNPSAADFTWEVVGSSQSGSGTVPGAVCGVAGEVTFTTATEHGPNTVRIFVGGELQDTKGSNPSPCG